MKHVSFRRVIENPLYAAMGGVFATYIWPGVDPPSALGGLLFGAFLIAVGNFIDELRAESLPTKETPVGSLRTKVNLLKKIKL